MNKIEYKCPLCDTALHVMKGDQVNKENGFTVSCNNPKCGMADWAHGKDVTAAFNVFEMKCGKK